MKKLIGLLFLPVFCISQTGEGFLIKGNIKGLKDSTVITLLSGNDKTIIASGMVNKDVFTIMGKLKDPTILQLSFSGYQESTDMFISNEEVTISGNLSEMNTITIIGSATQKDYQQFKDEFNPYFDNLRNLVNIINPEKDVKQRDSMINLYNAYRVTVLNNAKKFSRDKPASVVSSLALFAVMPLFEGPSELEAVYSKLSASARKGIYAIEIEKGIADGKQKIENAKVGMVGSQALDFSQKDVDGKAVSLASFRGKYVLVDFWASWCRPCRAENPNVVNAYQNYKNKNFTVLGVSLDQAKPNWVAAIAADNLSWTHVSDLQYWNNAVAQLYHIQSIPDNLLIDPNGKIIARGIRGEELQRKLKDLLK